MGFMDILGGGDGIDTSRAERLAMETGWMNDLLHQQQTALNAPFAQLGAGAFEKLSGLLGVEKPSQMKFASVDDFVNSILPIWDSENPTAKTGKKLYYDPITGQVQGQAGIDLGIRTKTGTEADVRAAAEKMFNQLTAPQEQGEDFGSLLENFTMDDYEQSPNYQFNLDEGQKAIDRAAAARGDYFSPEAVKELSGYSQNLASNEFLNSYNMFNQDRGMIYDMLMGSTNVGQQGVAQQGASDSNFLGTMGDLNGQLAQLDLARQSSKQNAKQSSFNNLMSIASVAAAPFTGGTSLMGLGGFGGGMPAGFGNQMGAGWVGNTFYG